MRSLSAFDARDPVWRRVMWRFLQLATQELGWRAVHVAGPMSARARFLRELLGSPTPKRHGDRWLLRPGWPTFPSPAFDAYARRIIRAEAGEGELPLTATWVAVTRVCPLACEHCSAGDELADTEALDAASWTRILADLQRAGTAQIHFTGGEPMSRFDDVLELVRGLDDTSEAWINTSGVGFTRERAVALADAGLCGIELSVDHWSAEEHDAFRGRRRTFEAARQAAGAARAAGLALSISFVVRRETSELASLRTMRKLAQDWGAHALRLLDPKATGRWGGADVALTDAQERGIDDFHDRLTAHDDGGPWVFAEGTYGRRLGCGGRGRTMAYVDTAGVMRACPFCAQSGGSLARRSLADARRALTLTDACGTYGNSTLPGGSPS